MKSITILFIIVYIFFRIYNYFKRNKLIDLKMLFLEVESRDNTILACQEVDTLFNTKKIKLNNGIKTDLNAGEILFNKYKVIKFLGSGNMGSVYLVKNLKLGNLWALKIIHSFDNAGVFREEGLLKNINHISIPKIVDVYYKRNETYIIEEYIEGKSLKKVIDDNSNLSPKLIIKWGIELSEILEVLHKNKLGPIIYRDLKPDNIIVTHNNRLAIIDFGISKYKLKDGKDYISSGSKNYAPKEQFSNEGFTDEKSDIYSLGMVLSQCILGYLPKSKKDFKKILNFVDLEFLLIILKAINTNRKKRYKNIQLLKEDLIKLENLELVKFKRKILIHFLDIFNILLVLTLLKEVLL